MLSPQAKHFLGIAYEGQLNRILSSSEAMQTWSDAFLVHRHGAALFEPAFEKYAASLNQAFCFSTLRQFSDRSRWPKRDKDFIIGLINESETRGRIAFVPAEAQGREGTLVALEQARELVTWLDRPAVLAKIVSVLQSNLGTDDSGIACPSDHPGLFLLCSI